MKPAMTVFDYVRRLDSPSEPRTHTLRVSTPRTKTLSSMPMRLVSTSPTGRDDTSTGWGGTGWLEYFETSGIKKAGWFAGDSPGAVPITFDQVRV